MFILLAPVLRQKDKAPNILRYIFRIVIILWLNCSMMSRWGDAARYESIRHLSHSALV